ncbi:MAG: dihydroneopterin aldolase [Immundisolibacter sp.]|uniref:dihydroneopterin aldolase n=1 Tax=Immundisolibacter sp. TaxID=1934948 RepID=UPI003D10916E
MATGTIRIDELTVHCVIGIIESERLRDQRIFIDAELDTDFDAAAASDHIDDTINYAVAAEHLTRLAVDGRFYLVEAYVSRATQMLLERYPQLTRVRVTVRKPDILPQARSVGVSLERHR